MIAAIGLAWLCVSQISDSDARILNNLREVIPKWTGTNGYEEFVKAAILLKAPQLEALDRYIDFRNGSPSADKSVPPGIKADTPVLELYKLELKQARPALALVRAGLAKPITYPRPVSEVTPFSELPAFKFEARLFGRLAEVELAAGHEEAGLKALTDGFSLSKRIPPSGDIAALVAVSAEGIMFKAILKQLPHLSLAGVTSLRQSAEAACATPEAFLEASRVMRTARRNNFYDLFQHPRESLGDDPDEARNIKLIQSIPTAERDRLYEAMFKQFETPFKAREIRLSGPEDTWLGPLDTQHVPGYRSGPDTDLLSRLSSKTKAAGLVVLQYLAPMDYDNYNYESVIRVAAMRRIHERLLALTCAIFEFRLRTGKFPPTLEALSGKEPQDPASKGPYTYVANSDGTFRLSCKVPGLADVSLQPKKP